MAYPAYQSVIGVHAGEAVMAESTVSVNRTAVLTLWAVVVAERLGFHAEEALSLGRAVAGR